MKELSIVRAQAAPPAGTSAAAAVDVRTQITRMLAGRGDAIVSDSVAMFPYNGPQPLDTEYCERLGQRLLQLFTASLEGRLGAARDALADLQRHISDRNVPVQRLSNFVYLMERAIVDELALDAEAGATSAQWSIASQAVRKASFE